MNKIRKAIIPAAGMGTRFLPATKSIPKEMFPIIDKPTIQYIVEECIKSGIEQILIIVSPYKNSIIDHFDYSFELENKLLKANKIEEYNKIHNIADMVNIQFIRQKEPLGLGHAILCGEQFVNNEPFVILLGDDIVMNDNNQLPAIKQCMIAYEEIQKSIVGVQKVKDENIHKYGIVDIESKNDCNDIFKLKGMVEKPSLEDAPSNYAILGRYVLSPKIFEHLKNTKFDIRGEIELTDALLTLNDDEGVYAKEFQGRRYDIGNKLGYIIAIFDEAIRNDEISADFKNYIKSLKF